MQTENRKEPRVSESYRKDPDEEAFLQRLNDILEPFEEENYLDLPEVHPTLHIIGAPRSGTTLLSQLIASHLDIGYINNLIAAFWKAPVHGIKLSKKLLSRGNRSSYSSEFGRTQGVHEPHEFGYFWFPLLRYQDMLQGSVNDADIDWGRFSKILVNMTYAFNGPIVFKTFLLGWHIEKAQSVLAKTCFVRIRRNPVDNAISLLYLREKFLGSIEAWASMKPAEYSWLRERSPSEQVVGQVRFLEESMSRQIDKVRGRNILDITYEDLCEDPKTILQKIAELLRQNGSQVGFISDPPSSFAIVNEPCTADLRRQVEYFVQRYYEND